MLQRVLSPQPWCSEPPAWGVWANGSMYLVTGMYSHTYQSSALLEPLFGGSGNLHERNPQLTRQAFSSFD